MEELESHKIFNEYGTVCGSQGWIKNSYEKKLERFYNIYSVIHLFLKGKISQCKNNNIYFYILWKKILTFGENVTKMLE